MNCDIKKSYEIINKTFPGIVNSMFASTISNVKIDFRCELVEIVYINDEGNQSILKTDLQAVSEDKSGISIIFYYLGYNYRIYTIDNLNWSITTGGK